MSSLLRLQCISAARAPSNAGQPAFEDFAVSSCCAVPSAMDIGLVVIGATNGNICADKLRAHVAACDLRNPSDTPRRFVNDIPK